MDPTEASAVLGVALDADREAVRVAHRRAIRRVHPDAGGSSSDAARVNEALAVLQRAPAPSASTRPPRAAPVDLRPADVDRFFVVGDDPRSLLARLAEAGHEVGEVVFVDPHCGILEIVVGDPPNVGQLVVTVGVEGAGGTPVCFTLDALGVDPAPSIDGVVATLMATIAER